MPFLTTGPDGSVYLSWIDAEGEQEHALRFSRWSGTAWEKPEIVARGKNWFINWADFPSLQVLSDGSMLAHWLARPGGGDPYGYGIRVARRSPGAGGDWQEIVGMNLDDRADYAGFLSFTGSAASYLSPPVKKNLAHHDPGGHEHIKTLRLVRFLRKGGVESDEEIDSDVCSCCQTASALTQSGLLVAYRDHLPGEIRDISILRFRNGKWSKPEILHRDGWKINGCPTEGPSIANFGATVGIAWMTRANDTARLQVAISRNGADSFNTPFAGDDGNPLGRPSLIPIDEKQSLLVWLEKTSAAAEVRLRRIYADGTKVPSLAISAAPASRATGMPKIALYRQQVLVAWRDERVRSGFVLLSAVPERSSK